MFESEVFHEHVDMSGIMLTNNSSLSPVQPSFVLIGNTLLIGSCVLQPICRPRAHEVVTMCHS